MTESNADAPSRQAPPRAHRRPGWKAVAVATRVGVALLILGVGIGTASWIAGTREPAARKERPDGPIVVRAVTLAEVPVARVWSGFGSARAMRAADIAAEVSGRVVERPLQIEPGTPVRAGELLVRIDPTDYQRRLAAAEQAVAAAQAQLASLEAEALRAAEQVELAGAERELAQRDLDRSRQALAAGAANAGEVEQREAAVQRADRAVSALRQALDLIPTRRDALEAQLEAERASRALAEQALDRTEVRSPIDGVLQSVGPRAGDFVGVGAPVARVVDLTRVEVPLALPASAAGRVGTGDRAALRADGSSDASWPGAVERLAPEADADARTITAFVEVTQPADGPGRLLPGMLVAGRVSEAASEPRLVVPRRAIDGDRVLVAVPAEGPSDEAPPGGDAPSAVWRIESVPVRTLFSILSDQPALDPAEREWAVLAGDVALRPGDRVVISNLDQLRPGMLVRVAEPGDGPARPAATMRTGDSGATP